MDNTYIDTNRKNFVIMVSRLLYDGHKKHLLKAKMSISYKPGLNFFLRTVRYFLKLPENHKPIFSKQNKLTLLLILLKSFFYIKLMFW